jgi:1-acyl-sn-glycerol-3-phosphate acyltransferase
MIEERPKRLVRYWIGKSFLAALGWEIEGEKPADKKYVMIAAPHTSNWDLPLMLAIGYVLDVRVSWMGKHTLFKPPFGGFFKWLGGVPVDRRSRQDLVQQMVDIFAEREELALAVPPEGTRSRTKYWKSGFYYIAKGANVPIALGFLDFKRRVGGFGPMVMPSDDIEADIEKIRAFYATITAKFPEDFENIKFRPVEERARAKGASNGASDAGAPPIGARPAAT